MIGEDNYLPVQLPINKSIKIYLISIFKYFIVGKKKKLRKLIFELKRVAIVLNKWKGVY